MDCHALSTPNLKRLFTFSGTPLSVYKCLGNSPSKFVEAGFERGSRDDEVVCPDCRASYRNWEGESPIAVHRVISPNCPFLNPPAVEDATESPGSLQELADGGVRRRLFSASPQNDFTSAIAVRNTIKHPIRPKCGGYKMHLASCRLQTYPEKSSRNEEWAENGFAYRPETQDVQCIYCGVELVLGDHPKVTHQRVSPFCALVLLYDVGNVSQENEQKIRLKYFLQRQKTELLCSKNFSFVHPHFEDISARRATYEHWSRLNAQSYSPDLMAAAGFFYTDHMDKVTCYACGVSILDLCENVDIWVQHAKASPRCPHTVHQKGNEFIQKADQTELIVKVIRPEERRDGVPGSRTLDMAALQAAYARQYTKEQILHAVTKYFVMTSKFPTKELLLGILCAADENHEARRKLRYDLHIQQTEAQAKDQALQAKDQALQAKDQALQVKNQALQAKDQALQAKDQALQAKNQALQAKDQALQAKDQALQRKDRVIQDVMQEKELAVQEVIQEKDRAEQERNQTQAELDLKNQEIERLRQQVQDLVACVNRTSWPLGMVEDQQQISSQEMGNIMTRITCKVCLIEESRTIFMPCNHISTCTRCASILCSSGQPCPVCRGKIERTLPAFIS